MSEEYEQACAEVRQYLHSSALESENAALRERIKEMEGAAGILAKRMLEENVKLALANGRITKLESSIKELIPILEAVRYVAGLGKNQMQRLEAARQALTPAKEGV